MFTAELYRILEAINYSVNVAEEKRICSYRLQELNMSNTKKYKKQSAIIKHSPYVG